MRVGIVSLLLASPPSRFISYDEAFELTRLTRNGGTSGCCAKKVDDRAKGNYAPGTAV